MIHLNEVGAPINFIPKVNNNNNMFITLPLLLIIGSIMIPFFFKRKRGLKSNNKIVTMTAKLIK